MQAAAAAAGGGAITLFLLLLLLVATTRFSATAAAWCGCLRAAALSKHELQVLRDSVAPVCSVEWCG